MIHVTVICSNMSIAGAQIAPEIMEAVKKEG